MVIQVIDKILTEGVYLYYKYYMTTNLSFDNKNVLLKRKIAQEALAPHTGSSPGLGQVFKWLITGVSITFELHPPAPRSG